MTGSDSSGSPDQTRRFPLDPKEFWDIPASPLRYAVVRAVNDFFALGRLDLAATLTYYSSLSVFPALLILVSMLGVFGHGESTAAYLVSLISRVASKDIVDLLSGPISDLATQSGATWALAIGSVTAFWSASSYVGAFGRALNTLFGVREGRPLWVLAPINLFVTLVTIVLAAVLIAMFVLSTDVVLRIGELLEIGSDSLALWLIIKVPLAIVSAIVLVNLLYHVTPNVRYPRFSWVSAGSTLAILGLGLAGWVFVYYAENLQYLNATYGIIGSVIVLMTGLWLMNVVLLFGAQLDIELIRIRQLKRGVAAEEAIQVPIWNASGTAFQDEVNQRLVKQGRLIRLSHHHEDSGPT